MGMTADSRYPSSSPFLKIIKIIKTAARKLLDLKLLIGKASGDTVQLGEMILRGYIARRNLYRFFFVHCSMRSSAIWMFSTELATLKRR